MPGGRISEEQQLMNYTAIHSLTDICWKKCVTGTIRSGKLDKNEESCTANCVDRFMDANFTVIKHLEAMRNQS
jgi:import inner membrane translocase subunit TIM8